VELERPFLVLSSQRHEIRALDLDPSVRLQFGHVSLPVCWIERSLGPSPIDLYAAPPSRRPINYPTDPSIWSWISRFISTAYSSGSSFVIGSTKPDTISAEASGSESPRDIR
jgi:hypothetical protein